VIGVCHARQDSDGAFFCIPSHSENFVMKGATGCCYLIPSTVLVKAPSIGADRR
jgi:hypothetical protein